MILDPKEAVDGMLIFAPHLYDALELRFVESVLSRGDTFLDIGAHKGYYSLYCTRFLESDGQIFAIEACPETYKILEENIAINQFTCIKSINCGVSDHESTLTLYLSESFNSGGNTFLSGVHSGDNQVDVDCKTLSQIVEEQEIKKIQFMKLDIEGFEFKVLNEFFCNAPRRIFPKFLLVEELACQGNVDIESPTELILENGYSEQLRSGINRIYRL